MMDFHRLLIAAALVASASVPARAAMDEAILDLQHHWAQANYQSAGKDRKKAFQNLVEEADRVVAARPDAAEAHIWAGIVYSTYAGEVSMFSAGKQVKRARTELEQALAIDPVAMQGSAYTSLGALLYQIPGFMGGDDAEAEEMLLKGLELNQDGIDSNYFYGAFLADQGRYDEAEKFLQRASAAPPRPGREVADQGRQAEIAEALRSVAAAR